MRKEIKMMKFRNFKTIDIAKFGEDVWLHDLEWTTLDELLSAFSERITKVLDTCTSHYTKTTGA